jgi:uncharacterized OB-fold protein
VAATPVPRVSVVNRPFFEGCNAGALRIQRCAEPGCRRHIFYPRVCCPHCGGGEVEWVDASGRGSVISFTVVHRPGHSAFLAEAPYVFAAVRLAEGPTIYGRLDVSPDATRGLIGRPVRAVFRDHVPGQRLVAFAPKTG